MKLHTTGAGHVVLLAIWGLMTAAAPGALATVYRCGSSYQASPCPDGKAVAVDDTRDAEQVHAAQAQAAKDERVAKALAAERKERDKSVKPQTRAAGIPVQPAFPASAPAAKPTLCKHRGKSHGFVPKCVGDSPLYLVPASPTTGPVKH